MIHQELVINAFSERDSMLPQDMTSMGSPIPIKLRVDSTSYIHNNHKHNGRYKIGCKMLPENVKEASAHAPGRNNIFTVSDLPDLCTNYLGNACPAGNANHNRQA